MDHVLEVGIRAKESRRLGTFVFSSAMGTVPLEVALPAWNAAFTHATTAAVPVSFRGSGTAPV